jgi:hypothetical protein
VAAAGLNDSRGMAFLMVKPAYLFFAFLTLLIFVAILIAFVVGPDSGPFQKGYYPGAEHSLVSVK